jgi:hypothetical protein
MLRGAPKPQAAESDGSYSGSIRTSQRNRKRKSFPDEEAKDELALLPQTAEDLEAANSLLSILLEHRSKTSSPQSHMRDEGDETDGSPRLLQHDDDAASLTTAASNPHSRSLAARSHAGSYAARRVASGGGPASSETHHRAESHAHHAAPGAASSKFAAAAAGAAGSSARGAAKRSRPNTPLRPEALPASGASSPRSSTESELEHFKSIVHQMIERRLAARTAAVTDGF